MPGNQPSDQLQRFFAEMDAGLEKGYVPARIFNDPELHQLELERIFAKAWVFIGHESEVPNKGDYCTRYIGNDPFIFTRDDAGKIRVLFNGCRHRGAKVCRMEKGNAVTFSCPYHGWTYKNTGELIGVPAYNLAYKGLDRKEWGLLPAPHVASLHGFVFASLDPEAPSLEDYLGDMKWYFDMLFGLHEEGWEVVGTPNRWIVKANWKTGSENLAGDNYHTTFAHKSLFEVGVAPFGHEANMSGYHIVAGNGHALSLSMSPQDKEAKVKFWGFPDEVVSRLKPDRCSKAHYEVAMKSRNTMGTIFPNFSFIRVPVTPDPKRVPPVTFTRLWMWRPLTSDTIEEWSWVLVAKGASKDYNEQSYRAGIAAFGPAGIFEQDDTIPWKGIVEVAGSEFFGRTNTLLNYQMGLEGFGNVQKVTDWPGPGEVYYPRYEERVALSLHQRWLEYMAQKI
ncbi:MULTISPECIES: Rieske 2Fe-2S domain-containing protein [unclassified Paenibacillus]|uniref:aromatic ring-hydroxylating oxygenase subunit alpha n=1 Tax=unclassified Paenibacillus TaxID=185978 RepID=UPI001AE632C9|nr:MULTISPECIES: Rieske 2Fe-2S domain-containing protein [unclassified Paenibacillus]MBP1154920.1 phenylpropionate dioxygenase-like ring-hydroxylating dioxygenase large terminal subunit [Paenibacillus sp. PvP091]MBP1169696.1 phenylpropionate dioxygenase-like ring-hydroxylating dioxygenase large terminal subunit [Paenibacillus sp. PvR098]MBP2440724.1 phenylpropionate dioxygenase-like ring-hydroxylating dioxygenase large terminal subunit [Paenibacillus sp. PvP052]